MAAETLTDYERRRLDNIRRNREMMSSLNLPQKSASLSQSLKRPRPTKSPKLAEPQSPIVLRRSSRIRSLPPSSSPSPSSPTLQTPSPLPARKQGPLLISDALVDCPASSDRQLLDQMLAAASTESPPQRPVSDGKFDPRSSLSLNPKNVAKVVPDRIFSVRFFPYLDRTVVVAGNKLGHVGIWDADSWEKDAVYLYSPHSAPVSGISIHPSSATKMYTSSYDGYVRLMDVENEPNPSSDDWIGVFSPASFSSSICEAENVRETPPLLCTAPIKYQLANYQNGDYNKTGKGTLKLQLINQREDFSFALFSDGLLNPKLVAVSNTVKFVNPKAPVYPRLAQGKSWNEMTVTWTSGYSIDEAVPFVEWGIEGEAQMRSPAGTLTFSRDSMCGSPARTVGWRDPGFIHTSFLKDTWPNSLYTYKLGHKLLNGSYVWSKRYNFRGSPYPGQESLQRVIIFGDMGKAEADGSNEYNDFQPGSLNTTYQLIKDLNNIDIVLHIGDISYANGYISQWDQFTAQVEPVASTVPYMIGSGNHERDWPGTGSFYGNMDSGGECGVLAESMFYVPAENRAKFWYSTDYGLFRFCIADTEHDWRPGTEQYKFIEHCLSSVDRQKQPWLIFLAHRVLGYSSGEFYGLEGSFEEPMGRESLQELWQKYKVDIAFYGHVHNYERTCPIYQNTCVRDGSNNYTGPFAATTHVVVGGGGASLADFTTTRTKWSYFQDFDYGFVKLTAFNHSSLLFEYKKSSDGKVYDHFTISRDYRDILACAIDSCPRTTLAS